MDFISLYADSSVSVCVVGTLCVRARETDAYKFRTVIKTKTNKRHNEEKKTILRALISIFLLLYRQCILNRALNVF